LLNILRDNEGAKFEDLIDKVEFVSENTEVHATDKNTSSTTNKKITIFDIDI